MTIPASPRDISPGWLTETLREGGHLPSPAEVVAIEHEPIAGVVGMLGEIGRLRLRYRDAPAGAPRTLIVKSPIEAPVNRQLAVGMKLYEREVRFYQQVAPSVSWRLPRCLAAEMDPATGDFVLLLEDLVDLQVGDQILGATIEQAEIAVDALADLHARWWDAPELRAGGTLDWIPTLDAAINRSGYDYVRASWEPFVAHYGERIGPAGVAFGEAMLGNLDELLRRAGEGPLTIVHNDFRLDNLFFDAGEPGRVGGFAAVDWQLMSAASGAHDLAYFLNGSLSLAARRACEATLVERYLARLESAGVAVDRRDLWDRYRLSTVLHVIYPIAGGGDGWDLGNERGRAVIDRMVEGYFAAALEHGAALV